MQRALALFSVILGCTGWTNGLCTLENGTTARCHELEDVKYIETYDLESLKTSLKKSSLHSGLFTNLTSLRHLDLSGGAIERIEPGSFSTLTNLRSLNLAENHIQNLDLDSVGGLNHLHSLNLRRNNLTHLPPVLATLKVLKHLDVQGNPFQCNCAMLRVKDQVMKRSVKISKKVVCAGPKSVKGSPLLKLDTTTVCNFEEQDLEMQNDQAYKDSEEEYGSGDSIDKKIDKKIHSEEYVETSSSSSEASKEPEVETPFPSISEATTAATSLVSKSTESEMQKSTSAVDEAIVSTEMAGAVTAASDKDDEIFFDSDEKKGQTSAKVYKDALFYPVEGSGDGDEGSGEGSGAGTIFGNWKKVGEVERPSDKEEESTSNNGWFDMIFNAFWSSTEAPTATDDPDLEEEQFIDASSARGIDEEVIVPKKVDLDEMSPKTTEKAVEASTTVPIDGVELVDDELHDMTKLEKVKVDDESVNDELTEVSPAKQSKKGMGSYVVLAALLAILATLIGFAAYKGDFCRKKRKRGDVENGTELKDMQKSLLDTGNSTQPKVASNGNVENAPLVVDATDHCAMKASDDRLVMADVPKPPNGTADRTEVVKPPRSSVPQNGEKAKDTTGQDANSLKDDSLSATASSIDPVVNSTPISRLPDVNGPPLSPGAQRVKITLQENPDSVPRTPILITRTMAGDNLVKMP